MQEKIVTLKRKKTKEEPLDWAEEVKKEATIVEKSSEDHVEEDWADQVEESKDLRARFTGAQCVVIEPGQNQYFSIKRGDIITGFKQTVRPAWLKGTLEGREGPVYVRDIDFEPLFEGGGQSRD